ncbi:helix-turn-helix transcriptional regulator [Yoonia sp.]|uniref:helix-turn-helix transcriptional regulator n=1 Tax=Yoonia sp. TaxID=2212373 RepID=UPI00239646CA|nr:helix-turn-helix transcriptional regulator [Yoonia sp.]MDE0852586.1 helix-turn-helix transcriptional regulator [Yoonia sp.]
MLNNIRELRETRALNQKQLGALMGFTESTISRMEGGSRMIKMEDALALARILRVDVAALFPGGSQGGVAESLLVPDVGIAGLNLWSTKERNASNATIPVIPAGAFSHLAHSGLLLADDHAAELTPAGSYVITIPYDKASRITPVLDEWVVITCTEGRLTRSVVGKVKAQRPSGFQIPAGDETIPIDSANKITGLVVSTYNSIK